MGKPEPTTNAWSAELDRVARLTTLVTLAWNLEELRQGRVKEDTDKLRIITVALEVIEQVVASAAS